MHIKKQEKTSTTNKLIDNSLPVVPRGVGAQWVFGTYRVGAHRCSKPVLTPVDPRMNKYPKTMNILPHASNNRKVYR